MIFICKKNKMKIFSPTQLQNASISGLMKSPKENS